VCVSLCVFLNRDSSNVIATDYELDGQGWFPGKEKRLFSMPQLPDQLWAI
jgi:hypothetical protein